MILGRRETNIIKHYQVQEKQPKIQVRPAYRDEWDDAMALAWRTFMRFEANDYATEGIKSFQDFITDTVLHRMFVMGSYQLFCAFDGKKLIGMISLRNETHISLLFVDAQYHKRGIGRALIDYVGKYVLLEEGFRNLTVNAAPYAIGFYHKLGFYDTDTEQTSDGIRYTPMEKKLV
ncbi:MAG: GNAT family N-acetyltransferase [Lachnospiraceae bacterium]|nr:GNAT family N-acetyltransferase [Lachnospiraceae bacterium]